MTFYTVSLLIWRNLSQNAEAVCEKLSTPHDATACRTAFNSSCLRKSCFLSLRFAGVDICADLLYFVSARRSSLTEWHCIHNSCCSRCLGVVSAGHNCCNLARAQGGAAGESVQEDSSPQAYARPTETQEGTTTVNVTETLEGETVQLSSSSP